MVSILFGIKKSIQELKQRTKRSIFIKKQLINAKLDRKAKWRRKAKSLKSKKLGSKPDEEKILKVIDTKLEEEKNISCFVSSNSNIVEESKDRSTKPEKSTKLI